jgi:hypothetical protein
MVTKESVQKLFQEVVQEKGVVYSKSFNKRDDPKFTLSELK